MEIVTLTAYGYHRVSVGNPGFTNTPVPCLAHDKVNVGFPLPHLRHVETVELC